MNGGCFSELANVSTGTKMTPMGCYPYSFHLWERHQNIGLEIVVESTHSLTMMFFHYCNILYMENKRTTIIQVNENVSGVHPSSIFPETWH